jgi:hypothetical protein
MHGEGACTTVGEGEGQENIFWTTSKNRNCKIENGRLKTENGNGKSNLADCFDVASMIDEMMR